MSLLAQLEQLAEDAQVPNPTIEWAVLVPLIVLAGAAVVLLIVQSVWKAAPRWFAPGWTCVTALAAGLSTVWLWQEIDDRGSISTIGGTFASDRFSLVLTAVICAAVILASLLAWDYLPREGIAGPEFYVLVLLSAAGGVVMVAATDLIVLFLGLEVLSIAAYVTAAMHLRRPESQEAGIKYFVLGAFASAFLLYGIAFTYGATGSTNLIAIRSFLANTVLFESGFLLVGFGLMLVGFGFKIAAVPFHSWTPDVYEGSPTPAVAYMASAVKVAAFAALLRVFVTTFDIYRVEWQPVIYALAVLSLLVGSIAAVMQTNVKRILAYSSIAHAGFILLGVQAATDQGTSAAVYYLVAYTFMVAGSFGVATVVGRSGDRRHTLDDYRGLSRQQPVLALAFTVFLLAQAGVPLTTGFIAKFGVIAAAADARSFWLAVVAMLSAVIAAYIYLRIVVAMFLDDDADEAADADDP
ncbi:MAG: NADH-quinone oxidoreductase subunit N, partial [Acidimicrobiia bacterium]|nr:NADH-quinone oxidoreductase subunit N [Acidimicrobiia bacterium]